MRSIGKKRRDNMSFRDSSFPIATCEAIDCEECSISDSIQCHFGQSDLFHFYLIATPTFLVGGAGILASGLTPLLIWIAIFVVFFNFVEIRVMCSHCPHYAEEGRTLKCWANYGSPKLWKYRPGPMSITEKTVFLTGFVVVWGYPLGFLVASAAWYLLGLYVLLTTGFFVTLKRSFCTRCMNFACPLNGVPDQVRKVFWACNPVIGKAWGFTTDTKT
jgi:hypothetical protein